MPNALNQEIHKLAGSALLDLFSLYLAPYGDLDEETLYFHTGTNGIGSAVVWRGQTFAYFPIELTGFEISGQGLLPTPTARVANIGGSISAIIRSRNSIVGARLTRYRTYARFLDAVNFPNGNPDANPDMALPTEVFYVGQLTIENPLMVEFKLVSLLELDGLYLPARQINANLCLWQYRKSPCDYTGGYNIDGTVNNSFKWSASKNYDPTQTDPVNWIAFENTTGDLWQPYRAKKLIVGTGANLPPSQDSRNWKKDYCKHTLEDCKAHFGETGILSFSSFPGSSRVPQT